ncbi:MAG TPA: hypothetical protein VH950_19745 [Gaiellaceae bacterium]
MTDWKNDCNGPWIRGFDQDGEEFQNWKNERIPPPHHVKLNEAIQAGLDHKSDGWDEGDEGEFVLDFQVKISKHNPGWIDGYRVVARP